MIYFFVVGSSFRRVCTRWWILRPHFVEYLLVEYLLTAVKSSIIIVSKAPLSLSTITVRRLYSFIAEKIKAVQEQFTAHPGDILLCSFPKTGTTWLKSLAFAITTRNKYHHQQQGQLGLMSSPLLTHYPDHCVPFIEHNFSDQTFHLDGQHRLLATHIPYTSLPPKFLDMFHNPTFNCKIVYIYRDPKDTLVSLWNFLTKINPHINSLSFHEMFELFCQGKVAFGPYWDHLAGYWKLADDYNDSIMFLNYEDLKWNTKDNVKRLAQFLGSPFSVEEEEMGQLDNIIKMCNFENLSKLEVNQTGTHQGFGPGDQGNNNLMFRKGEVGDWKNMMTSEMKKRLDFIFEEKLKGYGISFPLTSTVGPVSSSY